MRWIRGCLVFALLILLVLSVACDGTSTPILTLEPPPTPGPDYQRILRDIVPVSWQEVDPQEVTAGGESSLKEWSVFYRAGDPSENPIDGVMYRLILEGPPTSSDKTSSFVAYDLHSPYDGQHVRMQVQGQ